MEKIIIVPNEQKKLNLSKEIVELISSYEESDLRIIIQDQNGFGICLPSILNKEDQQVTFVLPEQLCIFIPKETYICKFECILENQIIVPIISEIEIFSEEVHEEEDADDGSENEEVEDTEEDFEESEKNIKNDELDKVLEESKISDSSVKIINNSNNLLEDKELDNILNIVAPVIEEKPKKTKVEEIFKTLDEDFIKQALWQKKDKNNNIVQHIPIPSMKEEQLSPEKIILKNKMKNILLKMIS